MLGSRRLIIQRAVTRLTRSGGSRPELRLLDAAAQTRIVSVARIRLDSRKSVRSFKGIICDDISEFESYMPSHAVRSLWAKRRASFRHFEPEKEFRLATYAMWWIKAAIQEYILRSWSLVKMGTTANQKKLFF